MRVRPAPGLKVRDPHTKRHIADKPEGVEVPETTYWLRRIRAGDVLLIPAADAAPINPPRAARKS